MLTLFPDESIVTQSNDGLVTLTTHRICYEYRELGKSYNQSIMLEHITSCESYNSLQLWLPVLAILSAVIGIGVFVDEQEPTALLGGMLGAIVLWWLFNVTKKNFVIISSPSTKMCLKVTGMRREKVLAFVDKVEQTKHRRLISLGSRQTTF